MFRNKNRSTLIVDEELGMAESVERITRDSHETTPLRESTISDNRGGNIARRSGPLRRRGIGDTFGQTILSHLHVRGGSRLFAKSIIVLVVVSWSTFVLSFRLDPPSTFSSSSILGGETTSRVHYSTEANKQQPLHLRGSEKEALYSQSTNLAQDGTYLEDAFADKSGPMKLSLWLIPPGSDITSDQLNVVSISGNDTLEMGDGSENIYGGTKKVIDDLSEERGGPKFIPHITLGGASVASRKEALELADKLRAGLAGFGRVECSVGDRVLSGDTWNQALVFELVPPHDQFLALCKASREILGMNPSNEISDGCLAFPPPLRVPHMSLYYGMSPPPPKEKYISEVFGSNKDKKSFLAHRIMLWKTDPSSLEGVPEWEAIADISIL